MDNQHLWRAGITRFRIASLAANAAARATYERGGFVPYEVIYEKPTGGAVQWIHETSLVA